MYDDDDDNKDEDEDQINKICHFQILSLKWRNPGEWSIVSNLMCDKMNKPVWAIIQGVYQKVSNVVDNGDVDDGVGEGQGSGNVSTNVECFGDH